MAAGIAKGREIGQWLGEVRRRQLDAELTSKDEALAWLTRQSSPDASP
jgi:hypothetical protein